MSGPVIDTAAWASPWRLRSAGDKVLLAGGLTVCGAALPAWPGSLVVLATAVACALGPAGVPWRVFVRASRTATAFVLLGGLTLAVTWRPGPGAVLGLVVTAQSLDRAARTTGHAAAGTAAVLLLATTTPVSQLLSWLNRRGLPDVVVDLAGLVYRLLFVLLSTTQTMREAQTARLGYTTRRAAARSSAGLAATVLTRAWDRARRLEEGLAGRGYDGSLRVLERTPRSSGRFVTAAVAVLLGVIGLTLATAPGPLSGGSWP